MFHVENKKKPRLTSIIAGSSGAMQADEVAKKRSYLMAFVEVVSAGILRIAGLCFQWTWYGSIEKWHAQKKYMDVYCRIHKNPVSWTEFEDKLLASAVGTN
ncbi:putative 3-dehydrosphinganine reductase [Helianthus annuus]|nr:putative 3-dehydrosphinganine reductase [Helianthus annuus]